MSVEKPFPKKLVWSYTNWKNMVERKLIYVFYVDQVFSLLQVGIFVPVFDFLLSNPSAKGQKTSETNWFFICLKNKR